jgi:glycosyltransferase involved in cell wall biosynthesis
MSDPESVASATGGRRMRVLYITGGFPYPLTSGYLRHYHLIRGLSSRHDIDLVSIVGRSFQMEHVEGIRPFVKRVEPVRAVGRSRSRAVKAARRVTDAVLHAGSTGTSRALAQSARRLVAETSYDAVVLSGRETEAVLAEIREIPLVVDLCDATASRLIGSLPHSSPLRRAMIRLELIRVRRIESELAAAGRHLLFASVRDRDLVLDGAHASKAVVVPNGVDIEFWQRRQPRLGEERVVFSGAMNYRPNEDAALYLIREIMPRVWASEPTTQLSIVGREPTAALIRAASDPRVTVTGFVSDMRPHLESGAAFVAPLRFGAGIQNKLLEAMAMEMPIITSAVAAAGVTVDEHPVPVVVARDAPGFAAETIAAVRAVRKDPTPRAEARRYVARQFTWDAAVETLDRVLVRTAVPG